MAAKSLIEIQGGILPDNINGLINEAINWNVNERSLLYGEFLGMLGMMRKNQNGDKELLGKAKIIFEQLLGPNDNNVKAIAQIMSSP